jgi:hypothetical protein
MKVKFQWILCVILFSSYHGSKYSRIFNETPEANAARMAKGAQLKLEEDLEKENEALIEEKNKIREKRYHLAYQIFSKFSGIDPREPLIFVDRYETFIKSLKDTKNTTSYKAQINDLIELAYDKDYFKHADVELKPMMFLVEWYITNKVVTKKSDETLLSEFDLNFLELIKISEKLEKSQVYKPENQNQLIPNGIAGAALSLYSMNNSIAKYLENSDNGLELINSIEKLHFILNEKNKNKKAFESFDRFGIIKEGVDFVYEAIEKQLNSPEYQQYKTWSEIYNQLIDKKNFLTSFFTSIWSRNKNNDLYASLIAIQYVFSLENNKKIVENLKKIDVEDMETLAADVDFEKYQQEKTKKLEQNNPPLPLSENGSALGSESGTPNSLPKKDDKNTNATLGKVATGALAGGAAANGIAATKGLIANHLQKQKNAEDINKSKQSQKSSWKLW